MSARRPAVKRRHICGSLVAALAMAVTFVPASSAEAADGDIGMLVLRENGVGSASTAQQYIDQLMESFAKVNGWGSASSWARKRSTKPRPVPS